MVEFTLLRNENIILSQFINTPFNVNDLVIIKGVTYTIVRIVYDADNSKRIVYIR